MGINLKNSKIMIVDDNQLNLELMENLLIAEEYKNLFCFSSPRMALDKISEIKPDLLILDLMMPEISGFDVLMKLNTFLNKKWFMPIIVITANINQNDRRKALKLGVSDFVTKPFDLTEVSLRIKNTLQAALLFKNERQISGGLKDIVVEKTRELQEKKLDVERHEKKFQYLFNSHSDAINVFTLCGKTPSNFIESNQSNLSVLGYSPKELKTINIKELVFNKPDSFLDEKIEDLLDKGAVQFEAVMKSKCGDLKIIEIKFTLIYYNKQEAVLCVFRDITQIKAYIKAIMDQSEILKSIAWSQSHEFRAPVARILGILNLLEVDHLDNLPEDIKQFLDIIKSSVIEIDNMIRNITEKTYTSLELEKTISTLRNNSYFHESSLLKIQ